MNLGLSLSLTSAALRQGGGVDYLDTILGAGGFDYAFYDFSSANGGRLFQENIGPTPATVSGNTVGLSIGKEKAQGRRSFAETISGQPEIVANGNFDTDTVWGRSGAVTITGGAAVFSAAAAGDSVSQTMPIAIGKIFAVTYQVTEHTSGNHRASLEGVVGPTNNGVGTFTCYLISGQNNPRLFIRGISGANTFKVKSASVKEVPAHYATQVTNTFKPQLQAAGAKFDGSDDNLLTDWMVQAGANCIIAQIDVPAVISANQTFVGAQDAAPNRFRLDITSSGLLQAAIGGAFVSIPADLRGTSAVVAVSFDGSTITVMADDLTASLAQGENVPPTTVAMRLGALNNNGVPAAFFGGSLKWVAAGRLAITPAQFQQIRQQRLAS